MMTHESAPVARLAARAAALGTFSVVLAGSGAAFADTPSTWEDSPHVSGADFLLVLFLIPAAVALVIALLVALPSLVKGGSSYHAGQPWLGESEWFGGPRGGLEDAEGADQQALEPGADRGGAGARY
ncbi:MAG: hypothetical protein ACR2FG_04580 [Marmoricola sp.]